MASEDEDKARRLAEALVDDLHGDLGAPFEEAAAQGKVMEAFAAELTTLRATFKKRAPAVPGRDIFGEALRALVSGFGEQDQVPLEPAAGGGASPATPRAQDDGSSAPTGAVSAAQLAAAGDGDPAQVARLRAALREARRRVRRLEAENQALREELLSAGEMIETLALDLERPVTE